MALKGTAIKKEDVFIGNNMITPVIQLSLENDIRKSVNKAQENSKGLKDSFGFLAQKFTVNLCMMLPYDLGRIICSFF